jgi:tetratricopeptide (TPR) repeat protein
VGTRLRAAIAAAVGLVGMAAIFAAWGSLKYLAVDPVEPASIDEALAALDQSKFNDAKRIIGDMQDAPATPELLGGAMFVLGAAKAYEADAEPSVDRQMAEFQVAARYLEKALALGVPEGREGQTAYLLGASLANSGASQESIAPLREALADPAQPKTEIHALLVRALLGLPDPNLEEALQHNQLVISDRALPKSRLEEAWLVRAETLIRLHRPEEALAALAQAASNPELEARRMLLTGRLELDEAARSTLSADERAAKIAAALGHLAKAQQLDGTNGPLSRQALYWMARGEELAGRRDAALAHYERLSKTYGDAPEGLVGMLAEADYARTAGQSARALAGYRAVLQAVGSPLTYANPLLTLRDLRERLTEAYSRFAAEGQFGEALALVDMFEPVFSRVECTQLRAKTHQHWGAARRDQAAREKRVAAEQMRQEGRLHMRAAGRAYEDLARMRFATRFFPEDLWIAADCYFQGQSFTSAARVLDEYLHHEAQRWNALALVRLGQSRLALGQNEDAVRALEECIEIYPEDAVVYQARLECARAYQQIDKPAKAERLLVTNLAAAALTPISPEWEDSKFALGHLLYESGRYEEAITHLLEAVERYKQHEAALVAKYTIARAYHNAAENLSTQLRAPNQDNEAQTARNRKLLDEYLHSAYATYLDVQKSITLEGASEHDPLTRSLLRNCYMMQGSVLFELRRFEEARQAYQKVITLYQNDPVVLESFVQVANCWRRLDQPVMARGNLKQAKMVLDKLPKDADFLASTNFNRRQWESLLDEMSKW